MLAVLTTMLSALGHDGFPVNPLLGEPGFPDCRQTIPLEQVAKQSLVSSTPLSHREAG